MSPASWQKKNVESKNCNHHHGISCWLIWCSQVSQQWQHSTNQFGCSEVSTSLSGNPSVNGCPSSTPVPDFLYYLYFVTSGLVCRVTGEFLFQTKLLAWGCLGLDFRFHVCKGNGNKNGLKNFGSWTGMGPLRFSSINWMTETWQTLLWSLQGPNWLTVSVAWCLLMGKKRCRSEWWLYR